MKDLILTFINISKVLENLEDPSKNLDLTQEEFSELLIALKSGNSALFQQVFTAQVPSCISFLKQKYRSSHDDAYDISIETLLIFRQRLVDDKISYGNLKFLFQQMASQNYLRLLKINNKISEGEPQDFVKEDELDLVFTDENISKLQKAFAKLQEMCSKILKMHYYDGMRFNDIALALGKTHDAIRKQKERCKETLIELFNAQD